MTREEELDWLCRLRSEIYVYMPKEWLIPMNNALDMVIKQLEQEPRKITYEDVKGYCKPRCLTIIDNELLYELTHPKIKALDQEPKEGHWITKQNEVFKYYCDKCGTGDNLRTNYCSNCGARMVEPQERSDKE